MGKVVAVATVSLDGFVAGPNESGMEHLFAWFAGGEIEFPSSCARRGMPVQASPGRRVGAGIHTGKVWFGAVGEGSHVELTSLGDVVNTTARLASAAGAGEILVTVEAASSIGLDANLERRSLQVKGKEQPIDIVVVGVGVPIR